MVRDRPDGKILQLRVFMAERHLRPEISMIACALVAGLVSLLAAGDATQASRTVTLCAPGNLAKHCQFHSFTAAVESLQDGDRLEMEAGDYREAAVLTANGVTIAAARGAALRDTAAEGKAALLIMSNNTVVEGLECSGIVVPDLNGACIRLRGRNLTLRNVHFHDSQQGLLSGGEVGVVIVEDSLFERLGSVGRAHAIYMSGGTHLIVRRSRIVSSREEAHEIKSRALKTTIEDSEIGSSLGQDSRTIDLPNGGSITIRNNVLQKGPNSANPDLIGIALEDDSPTHPDSTAIITGNTIIMDRPGLLVHSTVPVEMTDNNIVAGSPRSGNRWYPDRLAAGLPPAPELQPVALGRTSQDEWAQSAPSRQRAKDRVAFSKTGLAKVDQTVTWLGHPLSLTATESSIVALLSSRPGESTPLIELYKIIKPVESRLRPSAKDRQNVVLSAIKELRRKFRDVDQSFSAMTFQPGKGFIWDENQ
jgi:hypothetical protein